MQAKPGTNEYQTGYIAAANLFAANQFLSCTGVVVRAEEKTACNDTARLSNTLAKNQWFRVFIPPRHTFLSLDSPVKKQHPYILEHLCAQEALSVIYIKEGRDFLHKLNEYLRNTGAEDDPGAAQIEVAEFYAEKRRAVENMDVKEYLQFILEKAAGREKALVSSYLYHFGVSGLSFTSTAGGESFLLFNPRRDSIIKEIKRSILDDSRLVS
jgi:hypothetical protein